MIRHGDWEEGIAADLAMLPAPLDGRGMVLDLGCGIGRLACPYAAKHNVSVVGVDISERMLSRAQQCNRVGYWVDDGRSLPTFSPLLGAFSVLMFQHIPRPAQFKYVQQVADRLCPGARFTFQTVVGDDECFLSHQVGMWEPEHWCNCAGLVVERSEEAVWPQWLWTTAIKPE